MRPFLVILILIACTRVTEAKELRFRIVDADSGKPLVSAKVTRWASRWQPRILMPPGKFWFPEGTFATDADGLVSIEKHAWDDRYLFKADGYEDAFVKKSWFKYTIFGNSEDSQTDVREQAGILLIPLCKKNAQ